MTKLHPYADLREITKKSGIEVNFKSADIFKVVRFFLKEVRFADRKPEFWQVSGA